jgi:hypothetical protein
LARHTHFPRALLPLDGRIDDVRIYNRALSLDEIKRRRKLGGTFKVNFTISNDSLKTGLVEQIVYTGLSKF